MKTVTIHAAVLCAAVWAASCGQAAAGCGVASTYNTGKQAQGETNNHVDMTAAHQSLPLGTRVVVRNQKKGKSIIVRIAEHAPLVGRIIDLTSDAMRALGLEPSNPVCVEVVSYGSGRPGYQKLTMRNPAPPAAKPAVAEARKTIAKPVSHTVTRSRYATKLKVSTKHYAKLHRRTQ